MQLGCCEVGKLCQESGYSSSNSSNLPTPESTDVTFTEGLCNNYGVASQVDDVSVAHVYADVGMNVSLPCLPQSLRSNAEDYVPQSGENSLMWVREGRALRHSTVDSNGILSLTKITLADAGLYTCQSEESYGSSDNTFVRSVAQVELHVKSTPPAPISLAVYPSSLLALVMWKLNGTGGYPITSITVIYQELTDDWDNPSWHRTYPEELSPLSTQLEIYKLHPNTTYRFRVWATNKLGPGDYAEAIATTRQHHIDEGTSINTVHKSEPAKLDVEHLQANPWVLSLGVLVGSVGFTVLVLAFFLFQNHRMCSRRRTYDSSDDMELVANIILNPSYSENDRPLFSNEGLGDRQALLKTSHSTSCHPVSL
nr:EOG090X0B8X [Macrothrix elegans]